MRIHHPSTRDTVVPEERIGEREDLAAEGRIRERLGIPDHAGGEYDLTDAARSRTEADAVEPTPVLEK